MTADPLHATSADARDELLTLARAYGDGQIRSELVVSLVPLYASALAHNPLSTFNELTAAVRDLDEFCAAADAGQAHRWCLDHGLRADDRSVGTRLASNVEALLARLCGGVA